MGEPQFAITVAPIAVRKDDAARLLGMSPDSFERYVQAEVRSIRRQRLTLYPVDELRRWAAENADALLDG
jgi:hypothetical protein